jgi:putative transposase
MNQLRRRYPSDLTDQQWELIKGLIPAARSGGRPRTASNREILNAIFYVIRTGCAWRYLPNDFPKWQTVYEYFNRWTDLGIWEKLCDRLRGKFRQKKNHHKVPSAVVIDSQSVKAHYGEKRGYDGFKKVRGRKRHILVDTMGNLLAVRVTPANVGDSADGIKVLEKKEKFLKRRGLQAVFVDGGYRNKFEDEVFKKFKAEVKVIKGKVEVQQSKRPQDKGSKRKVMIKQNLRPIRWVVERTIAWFNHFRRLARDFEKKTCNSEATIYLAMISMLMRKK